MHTYKSEVEQGINLATNELLLIGKINRENG